MAKHQLDWEALLQTVQGDHPSLYRIWFTRLTPGRLQGGELEVEVDNPCWFQYLRDHCAQAFADAAVAATGHLVSVRFVCSQALSDVPPSSAPIVTVTALNPDYTFEEFVVGPSNRLAHAACQALCTQPGTLYNPVFVHGASGVGKTHLLQATCAELRRRLPGARVLYLRCENFVNDFVRAIEQGRLQTFREHLRGATALIVDDVQFLENRESSQEELFHTFNALHQSRRQLLLSAATTPAEISSLQDRLVSRFNWGLVAQVDRPNRETREAVLNRKTRLHGYEVPAEVLQYLAGQLDWSITALENVLTHLVTAQRLSRKPPTLETVREVLQARREESSRPVQVSEILQVVSEYFGVRLQDLLGRRRVRSVAYPRQIAMYLARQLTPLSLHEVGMHFDGRDHSTILHAERAVAAECRHNPRTADLISALTRRLRATR